MSSVCPLKQRKESETQCQTDCKFDLEVVDSKEPVAVETRSSEYVSRYWIRRLLLAENIRLNSHVWLPVSRGLGDQ